jgi:predicted AlkP superfamily phosphohydrolase/phosphomutase
MPTRLLILAADALDKDLVLRWSDDGTLPTFRRLLSESAWGITQSPPGLFVGAVWPSFWTSASPARHARYCYEQLAPGSYEKVRIHPTDTKVPAFWDALSNAGKRVAVIDVPKSYVSPGLNGIQVVDWGTHDPDFEGPVTWPESLASELVERYGKDAVGNCNRFGKSGEYAELRELLIDRVRRKTRMIEDVIARESWDCVVAVFAESHCVGHQCWHVHDPSHVRHDAAVASRVGDPMRDVYAEIDRAIGALMGKVGSDTDVIVLGSHGMRSHYDATFLLNDMLHRIEHPRPGAANAVPVRAATGSLAKRAWRRMPSGVRRALSPLKGSAKSLLDEKGDSSRRYFVVPNNDAYGAIRVNLVGREPHGRVHAGEEFDTVCKQLESDLLAFVNVANGQPLVRRVLRTQDLYRGPCMEHLPDLMVEWNRDAPVSRVFSEKTGEIVGEYKKNRTGDHSAEGIFFAAGRGVVAGPVKREVSVMDFGPTAAARLGVAMDDVDGRSFADLVFGHEPTSA